MESLKVSGIVSNGVQGIGINNAEYWEPTNDLLIRPILSWADVHKVKQHLATDKAEDKFLKKTALGDDPYPNERLGEALDVGIDAAHDPGFERKMVHLHLEKV